MTGAAEMRNVIAHASELLTAAIDHEHKETYVNTAALIGCAHARGVLDLLGTYLTDTEPAPNRDTGVLHLLDADGSLWVHQGYDLWSAEGSAANFPPISRAALEVQWGPVREVWLR